ncbi:TetR/AcrR family transcriptional regulator [Nocardiopsis mangrovi]|uniref:TetR/AcrR family transcriptional regulator n=1 Tax=Nocardiopsis mangrovi TaxID=1179818 RepID=A0ABV9DU99_9ACTN
MAEDNPRARERIVAGAAEMIGRRGLNAASIRETARHARAPLGSTYHYFPGGKGQLAAEAVRYAGGAVARSLRAELRAGPAAGLRAFLALWRAMLVGGDFRLGCPVLAVSVEEPPDGEVPAALEAAAKAFGAWEDLLAASLREHGTGAEQAEQLATLVVAAVEGAVVMCRATRSTRPLDRVAEQLQPLIGDAVASPAGPAGEP